MNNISNEHEKLLLERLINAVIFFDEDDLEIAAREWNEAGLDPTSGIFNGLVPGMKEVGRLYEDQVYFIPELLMSADVLYKGLEIFKPRISVMNQYNKGKVLIGVVNGDIHDIGKNIVKIMLEISGFEICDLGRDVALEDFMKAMLEIQPDIICLSTMMSTTMLEMRKVIHVLREKKTGLKILVGGATLTEKIAQRWGASGYGKDANQAVLLAIDIMDQISKEIRAS